MTPLLRAGLFLLDPEAAHRASILALRSGLPLGLPPRPAPHLKTTVAGINFANPLGIAAGYDKNAEVADRLIGLGFGFAEVGSITPLPQPGNPRPRIFRLVRDRAVINRLGFNNDGHRACLRRLEAMCRDDRVIGVNVGANKQSTDRIADYEAGIDTFASVASYLAINISSPNTPGLRDLQAREHLAELLVRARASRDKAVKRTGRHVPLFLKIAPDLGEKDMDDIAEEVAAQSIEGLIVSNTTLSRNGLSDVKAAGEAGGLSGRPLFERSTAVLARMRRRCGPATAIIGVGGVDSVETALAKIRAGADLVQLYTGLVYAGPSLPARIVDGMEAFARAEGLASIAELRDSALDDWADRPIAPD
ncbi:MAG: quinone-dependent dihydroorotate dehydrogenase [Rhizobiaceae bacterium]